MKKRKRIVSATTSIKLSGILWHNRGGISAEFHRKLTKMGGTKSININHILNRQLYSDMRTGAILN